MTNAPLQLLTHLRARPWLPLALLGVLLMGGLRPVYAGAVIGGAEVLEGPANDILDMDGAAMAPDGTGGLIYRKEIGGVAHVFAIQFINGGWRAPVEVDGGDAYGASMPALAAGDGGQLLVVWVQPRNVNAKGITLYELLGASLQPGASAFGQAAVIDPQVSEPYSGDVSAVDPALSMNPSSGQAYVVYRAITSDCSNIAGDPPNGACPPSGSGEKLLDVRVARFDYLRWSSLGAVNRASQIAMRDPTAANAPAIGMDLNGNGVVAWQEPDSDGVARIWVRRLFGTVLGNVLQASPEKIGGRLVASDADSPAVAVSPYGEARIAYRIEGASGSVVPQAQLDLNSLSNALGLNAAQLNGVTPVPGGRAAAVGPPSIAIDPRGAYRLAWAQGGTAWELGGSDEAMGSPVALGPAPEQSVPVTIDPAGGGVTAWMTSSAGGLPVVDVRQDYAHEAFQLAQLAGGAPGPIAGLALAGSGQGDALIGWTQGPVGQSEVVGDFVQAPPAPFNVSTPSGWVRGTNANITWEASPDAVAGVTYTVYVDGTPRLKGLRGLAAHLSPAALGDGVHRIQVLASDSAGQQTMSSEHTLKVDASPPTVTLKLIDHRRGIRVSVRDGASGVLARAVRVSFGDGNRTKGKVSSSHEYAHPGLYKLVVVVQDKVGNRATVHLRAAVQ
jgi:hypothetical protein